jgi:hypothetical protein
MAILYELLAGSERPRSGDARDHDDLSEPTRIGQPDEQPEGQPA